MSNANNCGRFRCSKNRLKNAAFRIGSILSRCFCNSKIKETAYNWGVTYQTVHYGYNRNENKRRNLRKFIYQTIHDLLIYLSNHTLSIKLSCDILDHVADEIRSNKARLTLQLDESTRDARTAGRQGAIKKLRAIETYKKHTNHYQYVCFCSATILTSQIL